MVLRPFFPFTRKIISGAGRWTKWYGEENDGFGGVAESQGTSDRKVRSSSTEDQGHVLQKGKRGQLLGWRLGPQVGYCQEIQGKAWKFWLYVDRPFCDSSNIAEKHLQVAKYGRRGGVWWPSKWVISETLFHLRL